MTNLTDAQREKLKELINHSDSRDDIKQELEQAKQLNNAMEQLKNQVALKDSVHSSSNYFNEDSAQKQAYDDAIKHAEDIIKNTNNPNINPQDIIKALNNIKTATDNLHGEQRLQNEKDTSNNSIDHMTHLNQPQKDALKQAIDGATTREQVAEKLKEAKALDNAMKQLEDQVNQDPAITSSSKFENEDTEQQKAYNNAINAAKDIINQTSNPTLDKNKIDDALHNIQNAVNHLHGEQKLEQAKQEANDQLNHLNDLTNEQKAHFKPLIDNADTRAEVKKQLDIAKQLNSDMSDIKDQIAKQSIVHQSGNYVNADDATKQAYDNAIKEAKELIDNHPDTLDHLKLQKLINKIDDAQNALNGQSRFDAAQKEALKELGTLNSLNQPQRKKLEDNLNNATTLDGLSQELQKAKELNNAMKAMRVSIKDQDQVRQSSDYTNADSTQQHAYDNAVNNINNIITETNATMDPQSVNQATQALENAKHALNGAQKLQDDKNNAKQEIGNLTGLTDSQKHALDEAIDQLTHRTEISKKLKEAKFLNNEMEELKAAVAKASNIRQTSDYINEDTPQKEAYDNAIKKGQAIIDAHNDPTMNGSDISNVIQQINSAEHGLHGEQKLQQAKNNAINDVYGLNNLNRAQTAKEVQDIQASETRTAVEHQLEQAKVLNQAMKELKQSIADKNDTLNSSNYINEDPDKKIAYDNALSNAEHLLNQQNDPTMDPREINAAAQKVKETKDALHGADKLTQSQNESNETINHLPNLNDKQKQALNNLINQATTKQKVAEIVNQANELNSEMGKLKSLVEQQPSVHKQSNYLNEDPEIQRIYDKAIQSGQDIISGNTTDVLSKNDISNAIQNIELAKGDLHGEQKLQKAQQDANNEIDQLRNLNDPQRQAEHKEINSAPSRTEVQSDLNNAKALNEAMHQLENEVHLENSIKQSSNYINEDPASQNAYNDALQKAKNIINAVPDKTLDKTTIEQALNQLQSASEALHGEQKLQESKDQANSQIDRLESLNPGQVLAEKTLVNQSQTIPGVQEALQKAKELNEAMKSLRAEVDKENQVKTESKYINADHTNQVNYDSAINQGTQIITTSQPPELNKDVINKTTQTIINAQNNLNGEAKLTEAKTTGNQAIDKLDGLTEAQKDKERELINQASTKAQVNNIINDANQLNDSMKQLQQAINNASNVKQSSDYINEDPTQKNAYDKAIQAAKDLINAQPPTMDKGEIDKALANVNQALNNLHGSDKLLEAQKEASSQLNNFNNLTNGQHGKLVDDIFNAPTRTQVAQVLENAKQLNNTMKALRDSIADNEQVLHSSKYINEDPEQQAAYNQAVTKAKNIINDNPDPTLSNSDVQNIVNEVTQAKDNLHGDQKLATDKTNAKDTLDHLTHLNHAQRQELDEEIRDATTRPGVQSVAKLANQLNDAMKKLEDALAGNETVKQTSNYINEDTAQKGNYDNYVNQAKQIVDQQDNPNMSPENINEVTQKLDAAKNDLHGEQKLEQDKQQATEHINQMKSLNQAQKDELNHEIQQAQTRPDIVATVNKAKPLDTAMKKLRDSIADANDIKQTSNYINEAPSIQNAYDNAVDHAQQIINQTSNPTMDPLVIERDTSNVQTTKNNLHGERVLNDDKRTQTYAVNHLDNLNQAQKEALTHEIQQATRVSDVNNVYNKARALDSEMQKLKDIVGQQDSVRKTSNYVNEDSTAQQAYNDAIAQGQAIIDQTTQPTMSNDEIENTINKIKQKVTALEGEHKLQVAKENANNVIDSLSNLNTPQKIAEKALINKATTRDNVTQQMHIAQELNDAMGKLRNSIQDQATVRQESRYINENEDKQQAYNHAVTDAESVINEHNPTLNKDTIEQLTQQVNQAKDALNGVKLLNGDKQTAHQTISTLNHLNTAQQQAFNEQINNAPTRAEVQQIIGQADVLNNMMKALENSIKDKDQVKNSSDYINEDPAEQQAYDNAVTNVENILHQTTQPTMSVSDIQSAIDNVRNAKNNLHGLNKLNIAKDEAAKQLRKLSSLTSPQSGDIAKQIYGADTRAEVTQALDKAQALNKAMNALNNVFDQSTNVLNSSQFINEDQPEQDAYKQALQNIEKVIYRQDNPEMDPTVINNLTHGLEAAQSNLHGDQKLAQAKQDAANTINGLTHLNTAQREQIINKNTNSKTRSEVAENLNNAQALDQAMKSLENVVAESNNVKNSSKYLNEDSKFQDQYDQKVTEAKDLINQTTNPTLEPNKVDIIKNRVLAAENNLLGAEKLAYDKAKAQYDIDDMKNLNDAQKQSIVKAIKNAPLRTEVKQLLQQAKDLDNDMKALKDKTQQVIIDKASPNYTESSDDRKETLNQSLNNAEAIINKTNGTDANKEQVEQVLNQLNQASENLNGDQRVQEAKTDANNTIDQLKYLNASQQQTAKDNVQHATKLDEIATAKANAQALNKAMGQLKQFIDDADSVEHGDNYRQADDDRITAYDDALEHAQNVIKTNATQQEIEEAIHQISHAKNDLNGIARLVEARPKALAYINSLDKINDAQRTALVDKINQSHDLIEINHIVDDGTNLNDIMHELAQSIIDNYAPTKASINYINADTQLRDNFKQAINNARNVLNKTKGQNLDFEAVDALKDAISETKDSLNGIERLKAAKLKADKFIEGLNHINKAQLTHALKDVASTDSLTKLSRLINKSMNLDDAMNALKDSLINNAAPVQASSNYINADNDLKNQFDEALNNARKALAKSTGKDLDENQVDGLKQAIIDTKDALNGEERLAKAKAKAQEYVQTLSNLNNAQRKVAENSITNSEDLNSLAESISKVTELNKAMEDLHNALISNATPVHASVNYINADEDLQNQFDQALQQARNTLSKATGKPASIEEVQGLIQSIKDTKEALNGDQRLAKAKFKAEIFINQLKDLNNAQRVDSIKQANDTDNLKDLSQIVSTASDLNNSMSELKAKLKETVNPVKSSINYINADYDLKRQFNKAIKDAREALSKTKGANLNERDIQGLSQAIDSTKDALNGEQRLAEAKEKSKQFIKQLDTLNNAQNNYLTNEINKSDNIKDITNIVDNASSLNDAMKDLRDTVAQLNQSTKDSINYQNADEDLKLQFDNAINIANNVLNKKDGDNLDITVIEGMTQAIKDAKDALNGEQRLKNAQQAAHKAIDDALKHQLDEINHANATDESKAQAIKSVENAAKHANADIDHASSNTGVYNAENEGTTAIKHTHADELPKAKIDANNDIDQKLKGLLNNIDQNPNLSNQEKEKLKDDLNHAIENIKNEIDRATNKQAVADEKAKADQLMKGTQDIISAKEQAKQSIKDLAQRKRDAINNNPDLTDQQKAHALAEINKAEKEAIKQIENSNSVDQINKVKDDSLNHIAKIVIWDTDQQPSILHRPDLSIQDALVTGKVIVHRGATITLSEIESAMTLADGLKVRIISLPNTDKVADNLTAKVEVTLANDTSVIVDVPVDVIEKELQVAKDEASQQIDQATKQKLDEIDNDKILTEQQKEQAKAEVQKLKDQAIDKINNSTNVKDVENNQNKDLNDINHFDPRQFTLDKAKEANKAEVNKLTQEGVQEIKHISDLSPEEQAQFNHQLKDLESKVYNMIKNAKNLDELKRILKDFKAQRDHIIAQAHLLGEKHKAERRLNNVVNNRTQQIINDMSASQYQRQLAINRIRQIELDTMNAIHRAKSIKEVQDALLNGIRKIMEVGLEGSFDSISNQQRAANNAYKQDVRLRENDVKSHIGQTESYKEVLSHSGIKSGKNKHKEDDPKHVKHHDNNFINRVIDDFGKAVGFITLTGLLSGFWLALAKRRKKEEEKEKLNDKKDLHISDSKKVEPLIIAKRKKDKEEETVIEEDNKKAIPVVKNKREKEENKQMRRETCSSKKAKTNKTQRPSSNTKSKKGTTKNKKRSKK